jgi:hypothetical protein
MGSSKKQWNFVVRDCAGGAAEGAAFASLNYTSNEAGRNRQPEERRFVAQFTLEAIVDRVEGLGRPNIQSLGNSS